MNSKNQNTSSFQKDQVIESLNTIICKAESENND